MTAAINKDGHARIHHHAPGDHSPLEAEYIFADCFSFNRILLALGRRTIHVSTVTIFVQREAPQADGMVSDWYQAGSYVPRCVVHGFHVHYSTRLTFSAGC